MRTNYAQSLRDAADSAEDARRAENHLEGLISAWDEMTNEERLEAVGDALARLDGSWRASLLSHAMFDGMVPR